MNILHTESMGVRGGQPMRVVEELKIVRELGHTPFLLCRRGTWLAEEAKRHGITVLHAPIAHILDLPSAWMILGYVRKYGIDLIHSHNSKDSYAALMAARIARIPFVRGKHSDLVKKPGLIYRAADRIVTTGEKIRRELIAHGIPEGKCRSIPSYPDETLFRPDPKIRTELRKKYGLEEEDIVVGSLAGFNPHKRPHLFLPMLKRLAHEYGRIRFFLAGETKDEAYRSRFFATVDELGLEERVTFVGFVRPEEYLNLIDLYLCLSPREGVPQALMQAMMMQKAVVSTDVGGIPYLNLQNNLLLCDRNDLKQIEASVRSLLRDPRRREELAECNRRLSLSRFCRSRMKEQMRELYEELEDA